MIAAVDRNIPFIHGVLEPYAEVRYLPGSGFTKDTIHDADAIIVRTRTRCDASLLEGTKVRFIASATIGYDHIDTAYCAKHGIQWTNAPGCNSASVKQYVASALYHLAGTSGSPGNAAIGIIGVGNVGSKVAAFCSMIGMKVLLNDPPRERKEGRGNFVSLEAVLQEADIITLHVPLNRDGEDKTYHLVDEAFLMGMGREKVLINTSRGDVVHTAALKKSMEDGMLAATVLDVWENEPSPDPVLLRQVTIGTPHIAGYSADGKANGTSMSVRAVSKYFGLGIDDWFPGNVPPPTQKDIDIDCRGKSPREVLGRAVLCTYDIAADHRRLRESPETFERQRSEYPLRREFPAYTLHLHNAGNGVEELCRNAGFQCIK